MNYITQQCCFVTSKLLLIRSFYWLTEPALLARADTLRAGCDWWQVPAATAASPSHQLCSGLRFTHVLTQYLLRSSRLHACFNYQKKSMFGWRGPKGGTLKLLSAAAGKGQSLDASCSDTSCGKEPWQGSSRASMKVCGRGHFCTLISGHTTIISVFRLINCCGKL